MKPARVIFLGAHRDGLRLSGDRYIASPTALPHEGDIPELAVQVTLEGSGARITAPAGISAFWIWSSKNQLSAHRLDSGGKFKLRADARLIVAVDPQTQAAFSSVATAADGLHKPDREALLTGLVPGIPLHVQMHLLRNDVRGLQEALENRTPTSSKSGGGRGLRRPVPLWGLMAAVGGTLLLGIASTLFVLFVHNPKPGADDPGTDESHESGQAGSDEPAPDPGTESKADPQPPAAPVGDVDYKEEFCSMYRAFSSSQEPFNQKPDGKSCLDAMHGKSPRQRDLVRFVLDDDFRKAKRGATLTDAYNEQPGDPGVRLALYFTVCNKSWDAEAEKLVADPKFGGFDSSKHTDCAKATAALQTDVKDFVILRQNQ